MAHGFKTCFRLETEEQIMASVLVRVKFVNREEARET